MRTGVPRSCWNRSAICGSTACRSEAAATASGGCATTAADVNPIVATAASRSVNRVNTTRLYTRFWANQRLVDDRNRRPPERDFLSRRIEQGDLAVVVAGRHWRERDGQAHRNGF